MSEQDQCGTATELRQIRTRLWNEAVTEDSYGTAGEKYRTAVLEQYKIYVEMADRISGRRALANTFFVTLNTAIFTLTGVLWNDPPSASRWLLLFPLVILLGQCATWHLLVRSYRLLNDAKYKVVGLLEERLPASPYWNGEWRALEVGPDVKRYLPLTRLEQWVPLFFAATYLVAFVAVVVS
jgi:hypothetical protein